jgi:DNA primase
VDVKVAEAPKSSGALILDRSPEAIGGIWAALDAMARSIRDDETRAQYLRAWRTRFEREFCTFGDQAVQPIHAITWDEEGGYAFPETENESERRFLMIVQERLHINAARAELAQRNRDLLAMAKMMGFATKALNATVADIEADPHAREEFEAQRALYRRVAGVAGPLNEVFMPSPIDPRRAAVAGAKRSRLESAVLLIEAGVG